MCPWGRAAALVCAVSWLTICCAMADPAPADPEFGRVADGSYTNDYFGISYPLPPDWSQDLEGPIPSHFGYYVIGALRGPGACSVSLICLWAGPPVPPAPSRCALKTMLPRNVFYHASNRLPPVQNSSRFRYASSLGPMGR